MTPRTTPLSLARAAALATTLVLVACSGSDGGATPTTAASTSGPAADSTAPTTESTAATTTTEPAPTYAATIDELLTLGRPIVLAHTAGEDQFPASTLYGFGESVKAGVDMLDLNVNLTKDDDLLVQHDDTFDRNTDGSGKVRDLTAAEAAQLDAAYWFSEACSDCKDRPEDDYLYRGIRTGDKEPPAGYTADDFALPTLRQLVARFPELPLNIEIKGTGDIAKKTADVLAAQLKELGRSEASVVASFDDATVSYYHSIDPDTDVSPGLAALAAYVLTDTPFPDYMRILQVPPEYAGLKLTPELIAKAKAEGKALWIWPNSRGLENLDSYRSFLAQGMDGLNINFPAQGVQAVQEWVTAHQVETVASAGCDAGSSLVAGDSAHDFSAAGLDGTYTQWLPPAYDGTAPLPLVLGLHGWTQPAPLLAVEGDLATAAAKWRFVLVTPDITRVVPHWETAVDGGDVAWIDALLDEITTGLCIDTNRVYVAGMSNGAMMTSTLACALADRFSAAAPVAGIADPAGCAPARAVPVISFHGTDDPYLAYGGGVGAKALQLPAADGNGTIGDQAANSGTNDLAASITPAVRDRVNAWAARNGCDGDSSDTPVAADVALTQWAGCEAGATQLYTVQGGGHSWPGSAFDQGIAGIVGPTTTSIDATALMVQFFLQHPLAG